MCTPKPKIEAPVATPVPTPAAPPAPEENALAPVTSEGPGRTSAKKTAARGTRALKIDLQVAQGSGGSVNVPRG